jgi:hypothetical protein
MATGLSATGSAPRRCGSGSPPVRAFERAAHCRRLDRRTALSDPPRLDEAHVNKDRLYRALDALFAHKAAFETHSSRRAGELFAIKNDVLSTPSRAPTLKTRPKRTRPLSAGIPGITAPTANRC